MNFERAEGSQGLHSEVIEKTLYYAAQKISKKISNKHKYPSKYREY